MFLSTVFRARQVLKPGGVRTSAHQILKTIVAHNTVNAQEEMVEVTPRKTAQQALTEGNSDYGETEK